MSPNAPVRGSAPTAPAAGATAPGTRAGAAASATPAAAAAPEGHSAGARVPCPAPIVPASGAPRLTVPAASAGGARQAGPLGAPEADAAPQSTRGGTAAAPTLRRSRRALLRRRSSPAVAQRMAPTPRRSRRPLLRRRSWQAACHLPVEPAVRRREHRRSSPAMLRAAHAGCRCGAPFPRLSGVTSGYATGGAAAIGIRSPGAAAILLTCYRSTTCCRLPRVAARNRTISRALPTTACATATDQRRRRSRRGSATSTPWPRSELAARCGLLQAVVDPRTPVGGNPLWLGCPRTGAGGERPGSVRGPSRPACCRVRGICKSCCSCGTIRSYASCRRARSRPSRTRCSIPTRSWPIPLAPAGHLRPRHHSVRSAQRGPVRVTTG